MRLLVVEDEKKVASFIAKGFEQEDTPSTWFTTGRAGTFQALNFDYDVVVLDVMLPKRSGFEVVAAIRTKKPRLPVIMLTAQGEVDFPPSPASTKAPMTTWSNPSRSANFRRGSERCLRRGTVENTKLLLADLEMDTSTRIVKTCRQADSI
jgi:CheY-like chemotaxis protein